MNFRDRLDMLLSEDAQAFADSLGLPRISPWIVKQYGNGHQSLKDYRDIVSWVTNNNPNIGDYDFNSALQQAKAHADSNKKDGFDKYLEFNSNQVVHEFENGKKWLQVESDDCNTICHRLQYDCSAELQDVKNGDTLCFALQDPQDNTICIFVNTEPHGTIIGQYGKAPQDQHQEIKSLCVLKGLNLIPEAYSNAELVKALATKQLNVDDIPDLSSLFKKLSAIDIINCDLLHYAHYASVKTIYDLYNKTNHDCLLMYCLCYLMIHGLTKTPAYNAVKIAASQNQQISAVVNSNKSIDDRFYADQLEISTKRIKELGQV